MANDSAVPAEVRVGPSDIAGSGVFAVQAIARGTELDAHERLNHSCEPNLGWAGASALIALREIAAGEELTVDYATSTDDAQFLLRCHCPSSRCRQMITGDDWRIPQLQRWYVGHFAPQVQRRIDAG